jgi:Tol biopolymer transport system component
MLEGGADEQTYTAWVYDLASGSRTRVMPDAGNLAWSPDGRRLAFTRNNVVGIQTVDSSAPPQVVWKDATAQVASASWMDNGQSLVLIQQLTSGLDLVRLPLNGDPKLVPLVNTPAWELNPAFAPDNRAFAYTSNQTGRYEVFVEGYPSSGGSLQVTSDGGEHPQWINAGRVLAYVNAERKLFAAEIIRNGNQVTLGRRRALFGGNPLPVLPGSEGDREGETSVYLTPDGAKIILAVPTDLDAVVPLTLVTNWR